MSPTHFHAKKEIMCPPPLKINKNSHLIKKSTSSSSSSPSSSSSSSTSLSADVVPGSAKPSQRQPVIIYTHSPKVIHTHPRDFMALVQKLTGQSRSDKDQPGPTSNPQHVSETNKKLAVRGAGGDDNESSSGVTEEDCYGPGNNGRVNPCMVQQIFEPPINYINNVPTMFTPSATDFLCSNKMYYNYPDPMPYHTFNTRNASSSTPTFDALYMNQFY